MALNRSELVKLMKATAKADRSAPVAFINLTSSDLFKAISILSFHYLIRMILTAF